MVKSLRTRRQFLLLSILSSGTKGLFIEIVIHQRDLMETRICMPTFPLTTVRVDLINGHKKYIVEGSANEPLNKIIDFNDRLFHNLTYTFLNTGGCLKRVSNNESDFTYQLSFYGEESDEGVLVPVPMMPMKTSMLSGYNLLNISSRDHATALSNFGCFDVSVFFYLFLLIISLGLATGLGILISTYRSALVRMMAPRPRPPPHHFRVFWRPPNTESDQRSTLQQVLKQTKEEFIEIISGSSSNFMWFSFLFILIHFFMISSYDAAYSTSNIVAEERRIIKSYEELLDDPTASIYFYIGSQRDTAGPFRGAHPKSPSGRVWRKFSRQSGSLTDYIIKNLGSRRLDYLRNMFASMDRSHSVVISTSYFNRVFAGLLCGCSPEDELWQMIDFSDGSERDLLIGLSVSALSNQIHFLTLKLRLLSDSDLLKSLLETSVDTGFNFGLQISGASTRHKLEQSRVCIQQSIIREASTVVKDIGFDYYLTTMHLCLCLLSVAWIVLAIEKLISFYYRRKERPARPKAGVKRVRRRPRPLPFQIPTHE